MPFRSPQPILAPSPFVPTVHSPAGCRLAAPLPIHRASCSPWTARSACRLTFFSPARPVIRASASFNIRSTNSALPKIRSSLDSRPPLRRGPPADDHSPPHCPYDARLPENGVIRAERVIFVAKLTAATFHSIRAVYMCPPAQLRDAQGSPNRPTGGAYAPPSPALVLPSHP